MKIFHTTTLQPPKLSSHRGGKGTAKLVNFCRRVKLNCQTTVFQTKKSSNQIGNTRPFSSREIDTFTFSREFVHKRSRLNNMLIDLTFFLGPLDTTTYQYTGSKHITYFPRYIIQTYTYIYIHIYMHQSNPKPATKLKISTADRITSTINEQLIAFRMSYDHYEHYGQLT